MLPLWEIAFDWISLDINLAWPKQYWRRFVIMQLTIVEGDYGGDQLPPHYII